MLKNYIKIAWRNLYKRKAFSLIHILGLTIGITVCMMIFLYIMNEFSVDSFHQNKDRIYRVMRQFDKNKAEVPYLSGPYAAALLNDYPNDIKAAVRVMVNNNLVSVGDKAFNEKKVYAADKGFFKLFTFPFLEGDAATALNEPNSIVLTERSAKKYFGSAQAAMGKVIQMDKRWQLKVTGVAKNVPANAHMDFDMVMPIENFTAAPYFNTWISNGLFTYVLLSDKSSASQLEQQFPAFMEKYMGAQMKQFGSAMALKLRPLKDIYFEPSSSFDNVRHGDKSVVYIFISIAVLILVIACINFMNLATIRAVERSKEVGLRKVLGALRDHLITQFIGESVLLTLISCILSIGLLFLFMPWYNQILGYNLSVSWNSAPIYLFLLGVIVFVGFLAGSYPAFFLSAFSPIQALKGKLQLGKGGVFLRQTLVVVQFSISVLLIICTIVIMKQMSYVKNKQLGYQKDQSFVIKIDNDDIYRNMEVFKKELLQNNAIQSVSMMSGEPGGFHDVQSLEAEGQREPFKPRTAFADLDYVQTLGVKVVAGRNFSRQFSTDSTQAVLINRTAAQKLGFTPEQAIGKWVRNLVRDSARRHIVGVVEDFNFLSLKENMDALVISPGQDRRVIVVRLKPGSLNSGLAVAKQAYQRHAPVYPFEYKFLDESFDTMYKNDVRQQTILSIFAGLAIFIACLGLFGLASFTAAKRIKEIGVRKVLGSSVSNILVLLTRDLLKPVAIASLIAMPLGYLCMHKWLQNFAYRVDIGLWVFLLAAAITAGIAVATISYQSLKAALANPVRSLRSE